MFMRVGPFLFIGHVIIAMEGLIFIKFSQGRTIICNVVITILLGSGSFKEPFPAWIVYSWAFILIGIIAITIVLFVKRTTQKITDKIEMKKVKAN